MIITLLQQLQQIQIILLYVLLWWFDLIDHTAMVPVEASYNLTACIYTHTKTHVHHMQKFAIYM